MMKKLLITLMVLSFVTGANSAAARDDETKSTMSESQIERMKKRNKRKAAEAWARDSKKRSRDEMAEMEKDYQEINTKYREPEIMEIIERFMKKYKDGNRVGCAAMYFAQKSGSKTREAALKRVMDDFSDCYYLNGCSVGGLSRLYLASFYKQSGKEKEALKLIGEIEKDYKDAQDHSGRPIIDMALALKEKK